MKFGLGQRLVIGLVMTLGCASGALAQEYPQFTQTLKGLMTYRQFETFERAALTTPYTRKAFDLNALELKGEYKINAKSELEFEIEFEHGGTGSTLEYDGLEEFGEFETELEKGGEVVVGELYYRASLPNQSWVKVGKIPLPISLSNVQESYLLYPSVLTASLEASMIATEWREMGIEFQKRWDSDINVRVLATSGLNSELFRKHNWVGGGYQTRFEDSNGENIAGTLVVEYGDVARDNGIAAALYYGETKGNRYKRNKLDVSAAVTLASVYGRWTFLDDLEIRGQAIQGTLTNSDKVSQANNTLAAALNPGAYSSLGHKAQLEMGEISYRFLKDDDSSTRAYASYQHVDTMAEVEGSILKDDRFNQAASSVGLMQVWDKIFFVKAQYTKNSNALAVLPAMDEYILGFGFDWYGFNL